MVEKGNGAPASALPSDAPSEPEHASSPESAETRPRRRWWIWAVPAGALALLLGFALHAEIRYRGRAEAIRVLQKVGEVHFGAPPPLSWLSKLLGSKTQPDSPVFRIMLGGDSATDGALAHVGRVTELKHLHLLNGSAVTDAGLAHLRGLTDLESLYLQGTSVTDAGLAHIGGLTDLKELWLGGTRVTDAGLAHVGGLTRMVELRLGGTGVTDAGLAHIGGLTNLEFLDLKST
ncbi:MAG: leucine-rich repeat domain-containing protein, partial [Planctomycetota bacterium]